jgi:branched-chain amino acid transport system permease protein
MDFQNILFNALNEILSPTTAAYALAAMGLAVHFGYTGLLNFGQAAYMLVGSYAFAIATISGWPFFGAFALSIVLSLVLTVILGIPTLRLRADYLAIVTIGAAEILRYIVTTTGMSEITGASEGLSGFKGTFEGLNPIPVGTYDLGIIVINEYDLWLRITGWSLVALVALLLFLLMRSPWGRVLKGIREDEDAVRSLGKNVFVLKMQALAIGGVLGSLAGILFVLPRSVQPGNYATTLTFFVWTILLLGGAATILGPVLGAMTFWVILSLTQGILFGLVDSGIITFMSVTQVGQIRFMLVGLLLMLLVIYRPQGILGNKKEMSFGV